MALTPDGIHATRQLEAILYGERQQTEGKGTAILVHQSISITSWHIFSPRITAIIFPYGDKSIMRFSIYEPAIDRNGPRAAPFYHDLDKHVGETKATCSITIWPGTSTLRSTTVTRPRQLDIGRPAQAQPLRSPFIHFANTCHSLIPATFQPKGWRERYT